MSRDNRDGTFDLSYDDGDKEFGAVASNIRSLDGGGGGGGGGRGGAGLREGMKVEGNYRGKGRFYKGVIKRENRDGSFDVDYDDVSDPFLECISGHTVTNLHHHTCNL